MRLGLPAFGNEPVLCFGIPFDRITRWLPSISTLTRLAWSLLEFAGNRLSFCFFVTVCVLGGGGCWATTSTTLTQAIKTKMKGFLKRIKSTPLQLLFDLLGSAVSLNTNSWFRFRCVVAFNGSCQFPKLCNYIWMKVG